MTNPSLKNDNASKVGAKKRKLALSNVSSVVEK
jgi:hypothetical protein